MKFYISITDVHDSLITGDQNIEHVINAARNAILSGIEVCLEFRYEDSTTVEAETFNNIGKFNAWWKRLKENSEKAKKEANS